MTEIRRMEALSREDCLRLLGSAPFGRIIFTHLALPAVRPVPHLLDGGRVIIRAELGAAVTAAAGAEDGTVVAYQADSIDPGEFLGWSVVVVGRARALTGELECARYRQALRPLITGTTDGIIAIQADLVEGFRLALYPEPGGPGRPRRAGE